MPTKRPLTSRDRNFSFKCSEEEYNAIFATAEFNDQFAAEWARDLVLSRVAALAWARRAA